MLIVDKSTGETLTAAEFNQIPDEIENVISAAGLTPTFDVLQLLSAVKTITQNTRISFFSDSGTGTAYVLTSVHEAITEYEDGMIVWFLATTGSTAGTITVNIDGLGAKDVSVRWGQNDTTLPANALEDGKVTGLIYDLARDKFALLSQAPLMNDEWLYGLEDDNATFAPIIRIGSTGGLGFPIEIGEASDTRGVFVKGERFSFIFGAAGTEIGMDGFFNAGIRLYYDGDLAIESIDVTDTDFSSAGTVRDQNSVERTIGIAEIPQNATFSTTLTLDRDHISGHVDFTGGSPGTLTVPNVADIPVGSAFIIFNDGSDILNIDEGASVTLNWFTGAAVSTGNRDLAVGGVCTIMKKLDGGTDVYRIWGAGLS